MSKITVIADSTQLELFSKCPQAWYYAYKLNLKPRNAKPKEALDIGSYGHKLLEIYYKYIANKPTEYLKAIEEACNLDVNSITNCRCGHLHASHSEVMNLNICHMCSGTPHYIHKFENTPFPLSKDMQLAVKERFRTACLIYSGTQQEIRPHSPATVEVGFSELIYEDTNYIFVLEGKIDLLGKMGSESVIMDHKWQTKMRNLYPKSIQFRNYSMISGIKLLLINYIRMAKTADRPLERALVPFSTDEHIWWKQELVKLFKRMASILESANQYETLTHEGSRSWAMCQGEYNEQCSFTNLCEERERDNIKLVKIQNNYIKKEEWRPW